MTRLFTILFAFGIAFAPPAFADPDPSASDALAGEQAKEADAAPSDAAAPAAVDDAAAPAVDDAKAEEAKAEEAVPQTLDEAADTVSLLVKAVQDKNWALAIGFLMMLLVFIANKFGLKNKVGSKGVPWVVMGLSVASVAGAALTAGLAIPEALVQGVLAGVAAIGGWELMFKHLLVKKAAE
jgi:hypothetical protein|tara:strand:+ start:103 stop:648 length:546 start_codon:yes stop_codon:yes gene_type:complete